MRWHAISLRRTLTVALSAGIGAMAVELVPASTATVEAARANVANEGLAAGLAVQARRMLQRDN